MVVIISGLLVIVHQIVHHLKFVCPVLPLFFVFFLFALYKILNYSLYIINSLAGLRIFHRRGFLFLLVFENRRYYCIYAICARLGISIFYVNCSSMFISYHKDTIISQKLISVYRLA